MAITYTPTTNFGAKDSLPTNDPDKVIKGSEFTTEFTAIQTAFGLAAPNASPTFTGTVTIGSVDINGGAIDGTTIGGATPAAGSFTTVSATGNITVGGTVDGRDVAADGTKLDGVEAGADVTDTANVTAAGALMDSELTDIAAVKALNQGVATTDSPSFAGLTATGSVSLAGASTTADITFGDNDKAIFGAGSDLQIYHDASDSVILDNGTGNLKIQADDLVLKNADGSKEYLKGTNGGSVRIRYNNTTVLETTATGIDVTGTVTADGLTVTGTLGNWSIDSQGVIQTFTRPSTSYIRASDAAGNLGIQTGGSINRALFASNGDVSLYEDTGTTPKFFWDASAESLGIGTTSPSYNLDLTGTQRITKSGAGYEAAMLRFETPSETGAIYRIGMATGANFAIGRADTSTTNITLDSSGNVGIGTTSPSAALDIEGLGNTVAAHIFTSDNVLDATASIVFGTTPGSRSKASIQMVNVNTGNASGALAFSTNGGSSLAEAMRIDTSGNLLVGTTNTAPSVNNVAGLALLSSGQLQTTVDGASAASFNRKTSDGSIINLRKDGTTVGSIGVASSDMYIGTGVANLRFFDSLPSIVPATSAGASSDAAIDLGHSGGRFKDLYLSGGVYLGGTGAANLLDDYEEGTWTPVVKDSSATGTTLGINTINCKYTKIGKIVTITGQITRNDASALTGIIYFTGLPFTQGNGQQMGGSMWVDDASSDVLGLITGPDQSYFNVRKIDAPNDYLKTNEWSNARPVYFSRTYYTTS